MFETIFPAGWGITRSESNPENVQRHLGITLAEAEDRIRNCVYHFLEHLYSQDEKALRHYYRADTRYTSEADAGNFLMAVNYLTVYDLTGDERLLERAQDCFLWAYRHTTENHPMFTWQGGVRDGFKPNELYVKYTADAFLTCIALYRRTRDEMYLFYGKQFHNFLKQARRTNFSYKYDVNTYRWSDTGFVWRSFGGPIAAYLELYEAMGERKYLEEALLWGEHALTLQSENGCFYLLDGTFWNSDLTAMELRALTFLGEITNEQRYLHAACRYADWLIAHQREDGAWPIGIDADDEICAPNVGPGDMPNIALSLLRLHMATQKSAYLEAALRAMRYGISMQAVPGGKYPLYLDDPGVRWGFWSWDPLHDYSLSGDQSVHHIRGILFFAYYLARGDAAKA